MAWIIAVVIQGVAAAIAHIEGGAGVIHFVPLELFIIVVSPWE